MTIVLGWMKLTTFFLVCYKGMSEFCENFNQESLCGDSLFIWRDNAVVAILAHNQKVARSNRAPATKGELYLQFYGDSLNRTSDRTK